MTINLRACAESGPAGRDLRTGKAARQALSFPTLISGWDVRLRLKGVLGASPF